MPPNNAGWKGWIAALLGGASAAQAAPPPPAPVAPASPPAMHAAPAGPAAPPPRIEPGAAIVGYKTTPRGRLKLFLARPPVRFTGARPCVVFFHGGGWRNGNPKQFQAYAERLAEHGVIGISAQYRLMTEEQVLPTEAVQDARSALRFVRAQAAQLGCDPQRIGAGGGSSGGHLAVMTAVLTTQVGPDGKAMPAPGGIDDPADNLAVSPRPAALFLMNPPLNLERYDRPVPMELRRPLSPTQLIDASLPPTWIFQGTADKVVPFAQVTEFRDRAKALGAAEVTVVPFRGKGHGFFNAKRGDGGDFDTTVDVILGGLKKLGWIDR
ncbi:MAG: alpha/beta hydrolase [Vitreoscilla sp.]|nr:alpha/beta hydrolase [Vitreoscilla sp.]